MLQRDYLMRNLQTFFKDLDELLHGKRKDDDEEQQSEAIGDMYREYLKNDRDYYAGLSVDDLITLYETDPDGMYKAEMLAALLYHDALLRKGVSEQKNLLEKSLVTYRFINTNSKDYSPKRLQAIAMIEELLEKI